MRDHLEYRFLGQTVDDAAGEAFDKVGRLLGLSYPGGPAIMTAAAGARDRDVEFPRAWMGDSYDFSFSGLKTAARRAIEARGGTTALGPGVVAELAYGFQESVVDVLATKAGLAAQRSGARAIVLGGGVAANTVLRERVAERARDLGIALIVPRPGLCTDNAAMIGAAGFFEARAGIRASLDLDARPSLPLVR
jgi:N6-L-threonylcarbamoyladenine synthase